MAINSCKEKSLTQQALDDFNNALINSVLENGKAQSIVSDFMQRGTYRAVEDNRNIYEMTQKGYQKYQSLQVETGVTIKSAEEIHNYIGKLQEEHKKPMEAGLNEIIKATKALSEKVKGISSAICALERACSDNCNSKQLNLLKEKITSTEGACWEKEDPDFSLNDGELVFDAWIRKFCENSEELSSKMNTTKNKLVKIASVTARLSFETLKVVSEEVNKNAGTLVEDIKKNIASLGKNISTSNEIFATAALENGTAIFNQQAIYNDYKSLELFKDFLSDIDANTEDWELIEEQITAAMSLKIEDTKSIDTIKEEPTKEDNQ